MKVKEVTYTISYKEFEEGEVVTPDHEYKGLKSGERYMVSRFIPPELPFDLYAIALVLLDGQEVEIPSDYLEEVEA